MARQNESAVPLPAALNRPGSATTRDLAWSFAGSREPSTRAATALAFGLALLLHASLVFIQASPERTQLPLARVELDTFIPIETTAPPPEPPRSTPSPTEDVTSVSTHNQLTSAPMSAPSAEAATDNVEALDAHEDPAPLLTDTADSADWALLSGQGTSLGGARLARSVGAGSGAIRNIALEARDLSRPAIAPYLKPYVERNFPVAAKLARVEGKATVRATIRPDGIPTDIRVVQVDPRGRGFGETCTRTLHHGPPWKPELNRDGRPIFSQVTYTCEFSLPQNLSINSDAPTSGAGANRIWTKPAGG
jgi:outer membrane biosynthesis protein TonB